MVLYPAFSAGPSLYKDQKTQVTKTCYLPATHPAVSHQMSLSTLFFCFLFHDGPQGQAFLCTDQVYTDPTDSKAFVFPFKILFLKMH